MTAERRVVMTGIAGQPGPAARRASAALPVVRMAGSTAGLGRETGLLEPFGALELPDSLFGVAPPVADAPSGRNGRGGANRKPCPNRTS